MNRVFELARRLTRPIRHPVDTGVMACWWLLGLPNHSLAEIRVLKRVFSSLGQGTVRVFEWGMGESTLYYPAYLRAIGRRFEWHTIDHSRFWYERVRRRVHQEGLESQVRQHCVEFPDPSMFARGPTKRRPCWHEYPNKAPVMRYIEYPKALGLRFDVMFVDGRFRRRCVLQAREVVDAHGVVMLHDAAQRNYHQAFSAYPFGYTVRGWRFHRSPPRSSMWVGSTGRDVRALLKSLGAI